MDTLFSAISIVALFVGGAAMIIAFYKTNLGKAIIAHQTTLIQTLTDKVDFLTEDLSTVKQKNQELFNRNQYLEGMVTGKQELNQLLTEVSALRQEMGKLEGIMTQGPSQS